MINAFIAGWPVSHSMSPVLHGFWLKRHGIAGSYQPLAIPPEDFAAFMKDLPQSGLKGGNVTIPHKEAAFALCDELDDTAKAIGAVNTLLVDNGRVLGSCTDGIGFTANLDDRAPQWRNARSALVLGAGGAARAVLHSLVEAGIPEINIVNRTPERALKLAEDFGPSVSGHEYDAAERLLEASDLVINTTSIGMGKDPNSPLALDRAGTGTIVCDLVYVPLETPLLRDARSRGLVGVDGLGMLLHQAVAGFEKWFGQRPTVDEELRRHVIAELQRRAAA